jgi:phospholipid transport system transporter-binding protein
MTARLEGELSFARATTLLDSLRAQLAGGAGPLDVDLGAVTRVDSAGLALLLELSRLARARGREVRFAKAPEQVRRLAEFFGVAQLLALTA